MKITPSYQIFILHLCYFQGKVVDRFASPRIFGNLTFGKKLTWFERSISDVFPKVEGDVITFRERNALRVNTQNLLEFIHTLPHLECIILKENRFFLCDKVQKAFKSLVPIKKMAITVEKHFEDFIGSKIVESLEFTQTRSWFVNWKFLSSLERLRELCIKSDIEPGRPFFEFLKLDRLELLSISNRKFKGKGEKAFFQTISLLENLKTLKLTAKYVQNAVLSDKIQTLYLEWNDFYSDFSPNNEENIQNFIRGPGVRFLFMYYEYPRRWRAVRRNVDYRFLSTVDLRRYFPLLERVKAQDLDYSSAYKVVKFNGPLCEHIR